MVTARTFPRIPEQAPSSPASAPNALPSPTASELERAAATAWPAAFAEERDGWLLRSAPRVPHRRNNSALPLAADPDVVVPERFYAERGLDAIVAIAPAEERGELDAALEAAGWSAEGHTNVLVAPGAPRPAADSRDAPPRTAITPGPPHSTRPLPAGVEPADPFGWPNAVVRDEVLAHSRGEVLAFAEGQSGAVLCIRTGTVAGIFRLHVAPRAQRRGVGARLVAACLTVAPHVYAQVEVGNDAAARLFARAGFVRSHGYHYRRSRS